MCYDCGCNKAHEDHGDPNHLTYPDLLRAAKASGITVNQVIQNLNAAAVRDRIKHEDEYTTVESK